MNVLANKLRQERHIAPLVVFRILFGGMMLVSIIRFAAKGWIYDLYVKPVFFFPYYGFEWVKPLGEPAMYLVFAGMAFAALGILLGCMYRFSAITFFVLFTYVELIDKANYLNHYYFISIVSFLLIFLPAANYFSVDTRLKLKPITTRIPGVFIFVLQLQLGLVYFFAGLAKLNADWLFEAMSLRIWLPAHSHLPVVGFLMDDLWVAYLFSWFGAIYDLCIPFFLCMKKTRKFAYLMVVVFHLITSFLFQIGVFPMVMIIATLIFFSEEFHIRTIDRIRNLLKIEKNEEIDRPVYFSPIALRIIFLIFVLHFTLQVLLPFRYVLYPGKLFWTEQGFRFSWRVMLMEKAGKVFFHIVDEQKGQRGEAMMDKELTIQQEKMMATQPDMILQYAHHLKRKYEELGIHCPKIYAECYVTLNGSRSRLLIDTSVNLAEVHESFRNKEWILPFKEND